MKKLIAATLIMLVSAGAVAAPVTPPIGEDANWYVHVNLEEMRATPSGQALYAWVDDEIIADLEDEFGVEAADSLQAVTVFGRSAGHAEMAVILHGALPSSVRESILAELDDYARPQQDHGSEYYHITSEDEDGGNKKTVFEGGLYLSFGEGSQTLVTASRELLDEFLAAGGRLEGGRPTELLIIQADRPLLQGGLDAAAGDLGNGPWESEMFRNVQTLALVIADAGGLLDIRAQLVATDSNRAVAIANIVRGVVSLGVMAEDEPELMEILGALTVETREALVDLSLRIEAGRLVEFLD